MNFETYAAAQKWVKDRAAEHGGLRAFYATPEYKAAYPAIMAAFDGKQSKRGLAAKDSIRRAGYAHGDAVTVKVGATLFGAVTRKGWIDLDGPAPVAHLDAPYIKPGNTKGARKITFPVIV
jgi:hypothetical protein